MKDRARYLNTADFILLLFYIILELRLLPDGVSSLMCSIGKNLLFAGFFLIEGASFCYQDSRKDEKKYLKLCIRRFLVPYLVFSALGLAVRMGGAGLGLGNVSWLQIQSQTWEFVTCNGYGLLWIFPVMFLTLFCYGSLRTELNYPVCLVLSVLLFAGSQFARKMVLYANLSQMDFAHYLMKLSIPFWRAAQSMLFAALGEGIERLLSKYEKGKLVTGILGILAVAGGFFLTRWNTEAVIYADMELTQYALVIPEILLLNTGIYLLARWIGQFGVLELAGRNWEMFFLIFDTFYLNAAAGTIGAYILQITHNNFITGVIRFLCILIPTAACMLPYETYSKRKNPEKNKI